MKHSITIQRLCLFLLVLVLAVPVMAAETVLFNSTESPKSSRVRTLVKGPVTVKFYVCYTSHSGNIYELKKGTGVTISVQKGYRIRSVVLEDTEGGSRYDKGGLDRIGKYETAPGTNYRMEFVKDSGSQPDDNNIRFSNFDATSDWIYIEGHNMPKKGQLKIRRITVEYVKVVDVGFEKPHYDLYSYSGWFTPRIINNGHTGHIQYGLNNNNIATVLEGGILDIKRPGKGVFTVTYRANGTYAKSECSTTINVIRDKVTFQKKNEVNLLSCYDDYGIFEFIGYTMASRRDYTDHGGFSVTSSNPTVLHYNDGRLRCGSKAGEATITIKQEQNDYYEASSFSQTLYVIRRDHDGAMLIKDADEWKLFCKIVNEKGMTRFNARLDGDINLGSEIVMVGTGEHKYSGTFDGQGHTLTLNWNAGSTKWISPFYLVDGCTIKNLRVSGNITSEERGVSGLIQNAYGTTTVSGCVSDLKITSSYNDGACASAGMIQHASSDSRLTITDCVVKGEIRATTEAGRGGMAGFVYDQRGNCTLTNCLYIGENNATERSNTFANNATFKNCYYLNACGTAQGTQVTKDQLKSGEVAHKLQAGRNNTVWGQTLGTNNEPLLTTDGAKRVYKVDFAYGYEVKASRYATHGNAIYGGLPTVQEILGTGYNSQRYYSGLTFEGGFSASTNVTADKRVTVSFTEKDCYEIASKADWKEFCSLVNGGQTKLNAKMTKDVDLGGDIAMVGHWPNVYTGTFDGQNHTLTMNWDAGAQKQIAPFRIVKDATIKNLRTRGQITSSGYFLSGLINDVYGGKTSVSNCVSEVNITSSYNEGSSDVAGMAAYIYNGSVVTFDDCIVKGTLKATTDKGKKAVSGFVHGQHGTCTMNNCLYIGENNAIGGNTFADNATVNNCYYLKACGSKQGEQVTEEQLKNGEVAHKLQNGRDNTVWGQVLGTNNEPQLTADAEMRVCKVDFAFKNSVRATRYANKGKTVFGGIPAFTAKDLLGSSYNEHHYYTIAFADNFKSSTRIHYDRTVGIEIAEQDYYEIASKENWKEFRDIVGSGQNAVDAKMTADIDLGSDIWQVGNHYAGTFDGQGHTLTINWNSGSQTWIAPFYTVDNATIKNLRTQGEINSSTHFLSGLVCDVYGATTISGCVSDVNITSSYGEGGCDAAGMIECVRDNAKVTITDCIVKGKFTATTENGRRYMSGFVENQYGTCTLTNCLYIGSNNGTGWSRTFAPDNTTLTNCYYLNACGTAQGTKVTKEQLKSGEVTYLLQNKRPENIWGQMLGTENEPLPTDIAEKHIYKVSFTYNDKVAAARYANRGKAIFGGLPDEKELLGTAYDSNKIYTLTFEDDFSTSTTVDRDRTVVVTVIASNYFEIATKEDWKRFCNLVKKGQKNLNVKMTKDVDLGSEIVMAGEKNLEYSGTFDGQGHTLKFDWNGGYAAWISPFKFVKDVTIKNLRTKGKITAGRFGFSGLICQAYGNNTISSCVSDVDINGAADLAGMVKTVEDNSSVTFNDCVVKGTLNATHENGIQDIGGFVYYQSDNATCIFNSCLYIGTNNATGWAKTFAPTPDLNNCYFLNACGEDQGTKVTEEQLKNGYVAHKLQAGRTDQCYWAQQLGEMLDFYNAADKGKTNYVYYDVANNRWTCDDFRLTDGTPLPIGLDFLATKATYERPFSSKNNATLCLPYELPRNGSFKAYNLSGGSNTSISFKKTEDKLGAYRPYYITANGTPQLDGYNLQVKAYKADALKQPAGAFSFVGTVVGVSNATAAADNAYVLQPDGKFHKVTTENPGATVPAYRAYITCPKTLGAKEFSVILEGETTGIDGVTNDTTDGPVYDLQGRRVADRLDDAARHQLPAGVYIVGGRKVIVK